MLFRILKLLVGLATLVAFVWFGANVPLGARTLFEHLQVIGRTRRHDADALLEGARRTAGPLVDDVRKRWNANGDDMKSRASPPVDAGAAPAEKISDMDRLRLRRLLDARRAPR